MCRMCSPVAQEPHIVAKAKILATERTNTVARAVLCLTEVEAMIANFHKFQLLQPEAMSTHFALEICQVLPPQVNPTVESELQGKL